MRTIAYMQTIIQNQIKPKKRMNELKIQQVIRTNKLKRNISRMSRVCKTVVSLIECQGLNKVAILFAMCTWAPKEHQNRTETNSTLKSIPTRRHFSQIDTCNSSSSSYNNTSYKRNDAKKVQKSAFYFHIISYKVRIKMPWNETIGIDKTMLASCCVQTKTFLISKLCGNVERRM